MPNSVIHRLNEQTINQIAAGEVIENPASVIKELVENSLDAGATEVKVEIRAGGRQLIRIIDNGIGMGTEDALLCLERHATSKLQQIDDFDVLLTMGFRGEALPSIASISKMSILTKARDSSDNGGVLIEVEAGKIIRQSPAAREPGTTIEVKSLFFNVPVRRKFQKSITYDIAEIQRILTLLALGNPEIRFQLISDEKILISVVASKDADLEKQLGNRILDLLGLEFFEALRPFDIREGAYHIYGFIGSPNYTKHNRTGQYIFINRRPVIVPLISSILKEAYATMLPTQRYPVCVLHAKIPQESVDVNVHPQKKEVRLRDEVLLRQLMHEGITKSLRARSMNPISLPADQPFPSLIPDFIEEPPISLKPFAFTSYAQPDQEQEERELEPLPVKKQPSLVADFPPISQPTKPVIEAKSKREDLFITSTESIIKPQLFGRFASYLLLDPNTIQPLPNCVPISHSSKQIEGVLLLDTTAAQTRILFEQLLEQWQKESVENVQSLLLPLTLELSSADSILMETYLKDFQRMGISIRPFGTRTFLIDALPSFLRTQDLQALVNDALEFLQLGIYQSVLDNQKEKQMALAVCRAVGLQKKEIAVGDEITFIQQLLKCQYPFKSPLGKSIFAYWSWEEIGKKFKK